MLDDLSARLLRRPVACVVALGLTFGCGGAAPAAHQAEAPRSPVGGETGSADSPIPRRLARTARIEIEVDDEADFHQALARATEIANNLDGYVVRQSRDRISFKVPSARLEEAVAAVGQLGAVQARHVSAVDVTMQYVDLDVRIANLETLRARLQALVDAATNVTDVLAVERELSRVTGELEQLQGQFRVLKSRVSMSEVTVELDTHIGPGPIGWVFYGLYRGVKWLFVWD